MTIWILSLRDECELFHGSGEEALGWCAPVYGLLVPTSAIRTRRRATAPFAFVTVIVEAQEEPRPWQRSSCASATEGADRISRSNVAGRVERVHFARQSGQSDGDRRDSFDRHTMSVERVRVAMCGIAGFVEPHGQGQGRRRGCAAPAAADVRCHPSPRARRRGDVRRGWRGARHAPAQHHRPRRRPPADSQRRRTRSGWSSTARSTTTGSCAPSSSRTGTRSTRTPIPRRSSTLTSNGARRRSRTSAGCSASRCGIDAAGRCSSPATASASSRSTTPSTTARSRSAPKSSPCWPAVTTERSLNPAALGHYLSFLYTPADTSIFTGIQKLPPGHLLRWEDGRVAVRRYWDLPAEESFTGSMAEASDALTSVLADAVHSHLVSDVPLGALLSGGVDSSLVVALMARASSRPIKTFSIGFDEPEFDELDAARRLAQPLRHRSPRARRSARTRSTWSTAWSITSTSPSAIHRRFQPGMSFRWPGGTSPWCCRATAATSSSVATIAIFPIRASRSSTRWPAALAERSPASTWPLHTARRAGQKLPAARRPERRASATWTPIRLFQPDELQALLSPELGEAIDVDRSGTLAADRFDRLTALPWASQMMHFDIETYLPEDILTKVDRMSMAHSIESRVPLLDHEVVAFAASLPHHMKIRHGERKRVLKHAAASILPAEVLTRRKQGFSVPVGEWFRGPLKDFMTDALQSARARQRGYFTASFHRSPRGRTPVGQARPCVAALAAPDAGALAPAIPRRLGPRRGTSAG